MQVRIGTVLGVPIEQDIAEVGLVSAIRLGNVHVSSVSISVAALEHVRVCVNGNWYSLGDCGWIDEDCNLNSLSAYAYSKHG